jgi:transposase
MLPQHLPRIEIRIDVEDKTCPCGGERHLIGETVTEMLDVVPAQYRVKRIVRLRYGCRICEEGVVQAPAPARPVDGGIATEALLAAIAVAKFAWHLPLNRQLRMMRGQGIELDRSTLSLWIGKTAWWLQPLYVLLLASILARPKIFCDETPLPVFARGGTRRCQFWAVAVDDRPWSGPAPLAVAYAFATGRKTEHAMTLLESFSGVLQVDGYAAYKKLAATEREGKLIVLAFCLAHYLEFVFILSGALTPQFWPTTSGRRSPHKFWSLKATGGTRAGLAWVSMARPERGRYRRGPRSYRAHRVSFGGLWPGTDWSSQRWRARDNRV